MEKEACDINFQPRASTQTPGKRDMSTAMEPERSYRWEQHWVSVQVLSRRAIWDQLTKLRDTEHGQSTDRVRNHHCYLGNCQQEMAPGMDSRRKMSKRVKQTLLKERIDFNYLLGVWRKEATQHSWILMSFSSSSYPLHLLAPGWPNSGWWG